MRLLAGGREVAGQNDRTTSLGEWLKVLVLKVQGFSSLELTKKLNDILMSHSFSASSI